MSTVIEQTDLPEDLPTAEPAGDEPSEEAPYGYKADGTPRKKPGRPSGTPGRSSGTRSLKNLKEPLTEKLVEYLGAPLALMSPLAYSYWEMRAEKTADALLVIATRSPRTRKWIERLIAGSATSDIGVTVVGLGTAMLIDAEKVSPEGRFQHWLGLDSLYVELYGEYIEQSANGDNARGLYAEVS